MSLVRQMFKSTRLSILLAAGLFVLLIVGGLFWQADQHESEDFGAMMQKMVVSVLNETPELQILYGVQEVEGIRWDPTKLTDISDADYKQLNQDDEDFLKKLTTYDADKLSPEDKLTYDITKWSLSAAQQLKKHADLNADELYALINFPPSFANNYPIRNQADAENYRIALNGFSDKVAHIIDRIQDKQKKGFVPTSEFLKQMLTSYENLRNTKPEETILYTLYSEKLSTLKLDPSKEEELKKAILQTLTDQVLASYGKLADLIKNDLMKQAPVSQGIWSQPGGSEYYSAQLRLATGTDLSPLEIHDIAKRKVEEIVKELRSQAPGKANQILTGDELLQAVNDSLSVTTTNLSDWFEEELIPSNPVDVRTYPAPITLAGAFYISLSMDGDRKGRFFLPPNKPLSVETARLLTIHEGFPGHHFQFSIQYGQPTTSLARKVTMFPGFIEGWAQYAETLGVEMGLLDQSTAQSSLFNVYLGTVIDTGINELKWTREQANEYMVSIIGGNNNPLIDSVIAFPGIITCYAIGHDQFQSLREKAESELKDRFDIKAFHSTLLRNGSMPFPILEQQVNQYIESVK